MAIFNVKKDGTGTHTQIQSAIYDAVNGDTVNIGAGIWNENVELFSKSIKLIGAGKDQTIIVGKLSNDTIANCSWFAGDTVITTTGSTSALVRGKSVTGTNVTTGSRIAQVLSNTQFQLNTATITTGNYTKTVAAYQTIAFSVAPTSGTFRLRYNGVDSAAINWNDSAATIQTKLRAVTGLATVVVTGTIASRLLTIACDGVAAPVTALSVSSNLLSPSTVVTPTLIDALVAGSSTVVLPNTTSVAVGHKVEGVGVNATITAWNSTTRVITLSSPITQTGSNVLLSFRLPRTGVTITQVQNPSNSSGPASIMIAGSSDGIEIKNLKAVGFDGVVGQEASAIFFTAGTAPGHKNFVIDNCEFTADGDSAVMCGSNPFLDNGTFQNCVFNGKTFVGAEPADVPSFSTYVTQGVVQSIGASTSVIRFSDMRGIIVGRSFTSPSFSGSASISAINGNDVTFNKVTPFTVGQTLDCTFTLTAYSVPNCARNLVYIGQNTTPNNTTNIKFLNNFVSGQTGAVISATGSKNMFNSAVTIESAGGLVEGNIFDGNFGAGDNTLMSNFCLRARQTGIVVQNNISKISGGRKDNGFLVLLGTSINNIVLDRLLIELSQLTAQQKIEFQIEKGMLKSISKVANDAVFSNEENWKLVSIIYKHNNSAKRLVCSFRSTFDYLKQVKLKAGMNSGDKFELHKIIISKPDRTLLVLKRSEIDDSSTFDFILQ